MRGTRRPRQQLSTTFGILAVTATIVSSTAVQAHAAEVEVTVPYSLTTHCAQHLASWNGPADRAEALRQARSCDTMAVNPALYAPHAAAMLAENPDLKLMVYLNGGLCGKKRGPTTANPCRGTYLKDASGNYVRAQVTQNWLMRPQSTAWADEVRDECLSRIAELGLAPSKAGCYVDMLGLGALNGMMTGYPVVPGTKTTYTETAWMAEIVWLTQRLAADLGSQGVYLTGNGMHSGQYYERWTSPLLDHMPFAAENSWRTPPKIPTTLHSRWTSNVAMFADADKPVTVTAKGWAGEDLTWTVANQVITDKRYTSAGTPWRGLGNPYSWTTTKDDGTEYHPQVARLREGFLAQAKGPFQVLSSGVARQEFQRRYLRDDGTVRRQHQGWVYVNPHDTKTVTLTLNRRYEQLDGTIIPAGTVVSIGPQKALIIRTA